jgi:glycosyltransferase involved in cell wall biosynthesis
MCIDLCANLKQYYPEIGLVFCLPDIGDYEYFNKMKQNIIEKGIENNFLFITKQYQFYPILMKCDVFVRPTNTDGYGISIAEAIYFKVPAVASDVCLRPMGTILFENRDINDFTSTVKNVRDNYEREVAKLERVENVNSTDKIIKIYRKLAGEG